MVVTNYVLSLENGTCFYKMLRLMISHKEQPRFQKQKRLFASGEASTLCLNYCVFLHRWKEHICVMITRLVWEAVDAHLVARLIDRQPKRICHTDYSFSADCHYDGCFDVLRSGSRYYLQRSAPDVGFCSGSHVVKEQYRGLFVITRLVGNKGKPQRLRT